MNYWDNNSSYQSYRNVKFSDVYGDVNTFIEDYENVGIPVTIGTNTASTLYYLLYAQYGNDIVANADLTQFKYKLFSLIFRYGPTWEKRLDIQEKLRTLSDQDIFTGNRQIYNKAANPSTSPSTFVDKELDYINEQTVALNRKGKLEGYALLNDLLATDVTGEFIAKFKPLFLVMVAGEEPLWYVTEESNEQ